MTSAAELLRGLDKAATAGPWAFDEPDNWHGLAARIATAENMGQIIGQIGLKAWGRKASLGIARLICTTRNLIENIAVLVDAAERVARHFEPACESPGRLDLDEDGARLLDAVVALNAAAAKEVR